MTTTWDTIRVDVAADADQCPMEKIDDAFKRTAIDWCVRTRTWRKSGFVTDIGGVAMRTFPTTVVPSGSRLLSLESCRYNGIPIDPRTPASLVDIYGNWQLETGTPLYRVRDRSAIAAGGYYLVPAPGPIGGTARANATAYALNAVIYLTANDSLVHYYLCTQTGTTAGSQPSYAGTPGEVVTDGGAKFTEQSTTNMLWLEVSLAPAETATGVDDSIAAEFWDALVNGTKGRVLAVSGKPWSQPNLASSYLGAYNDAVQSAKIKADRGSDRQQMVTRPYAF